MDSHAPDAVSFQGPSRHSAGLSGNVVRWSGTETGHTPTADMWSTIKPDSSGAQTMAYGAGTKPGSAMDLEYVPAEQDGAIQGGMNAGGFWYPHSVPKTVTELMSEWEDSVGHNSNYLLELSPDPQGRIPTRDVAVYRRFGQVGHETNSGGTHLCTHCLCPSPCPVSALTRSNVAAGTSGVLPWGTHGELDHFALSQDFLPFACRQLDGSCAR